MNEIVRAMQAAATPEKFFARVVSGFKLFSLIEYAFAHFSSVLLIEIVHILAKELK